MGESLNDYMAKAKLKSAVEVILWGGKVGNIDLAFILTEQDKEELTGLILWIVGAFGKDQLAHARQSIDDRLATIVMNWFVANPSYLEV